MIDLVLRIIGLLVFLGLVVAFLASIHVFFVIFFIVAALCAITS